MMYAVGLVLTLLVHMCVGEYVRLTWNVTYVQVNRDGYVDRLAIGVNNQLPIVPVYITQGDTLFLTVHNMLNVPTAIHAHGLVQTNMPYMDGSSMITQCGIPPNSSFTYEIRSNNQSGTFFLHSHHMGQLADGLRTPFIIREKYPEYDEDVLVALEDWYATDSRDKLVELLAPDTNAPLTPTFPFGLINGYNGNDTQTIQFTRGKKYRLRVMSMSTTEYWKFSIPGHKLSVVEADGVACEPQVVDGLDLAPAQRYSVVVTAHESDEYNFVYNCTLYADFVPRIAGLNPRVYTGLIEYKQGAPIKHVTVDDLVWADDVSMRARDKEPVFGVDRQIELAMRGFLTTDKRRLRRLGTLPYAEPHVPTIFTAMSMGALAMDSRVYGPQTQAYIIGYNQSVELVIKNVQGQPHSQHQHGGTFQIIERGPVDHSELEPPPDPRFSLDDVPKIPIRSYSGVPMRRDTIDVPPFSYVKVRLRMESGIWLHHCHLSPAHDVAGLSVTFVVAPDVMQKTLEIPRVLYEQCAMQGIKTEGNAAGNWGFDMTGLPPVPVEMPKAPASVQGAPAKASVQGAPAKASVQGAPAKALPKVPK
ncbi:ferroxidase fet3 [Coemansia sp. RSA 1853]|nr:ferroxidase fet3 [Coemansia sp. RSA 1853]